MKNKYKCKICNYIYDSDIGDPLFGIEKGTSFNDIPENWICPICGANSEEFELFED
jgi:rubredoxin